MMRDEQAPSPPIHAQIAEVQRELALRRNVYPHMVSQGKMKQGEADLCLDRMTAVLKTLDYMAANREVIIAAVKAAKGASA